MFSYIFYFQGERRPIGENKWKRKLYIYKIWSEFEFLVAKVELSIFIYFTPNISFFNCLMSTHFNDLYNVSWINRDVLIWRFTDIIYAIIREEDLIEITTYVCDVRQSFSFLRIFVGLFGEIFPLYCIL